MSETLVVNYLIKGRVEMNVEKLVQKVKDLIEESNVEHVQQFIEEHKDELGEYYHRIIAMLAGTTTDGLFDKIKGLFQWLGKIRDKSEG